jgi:hypothetical protein
MSKLQATARLDAEQSKLVRHVWMRYYQTAETQGRLTKIGDAPIGALVIIQIPDDWDDVIAVHDNFVPVVIVARFEDQVRIAEIDGTALAPMGQSLRLKHQCVVLH